METKTCSRCGVEKPISEYYKDRDKTRSLCKACDNRRNREYNYKKAAQKRFQEEGVSKYAVLSNEELSKHKLCARCGEVKEQREFYYHKKDKMFRSVCKLCYLKEMRERRKNNRRESYEKRIKKLYG